MTEEPKVRVRRWEQSRAAAITSSKDHIPGEDWSAAFRRALAGLPVPEEHKWKRVGMRIPPAWWMDVDTIVRSRYGSSRASILRAALAEYLDKYMPEVIAEEDEDLRELERIEQLRNTRGRDREEAKTYRAKADEKEARLAEKLLREEEARG
jgi:hypothetical protein